MTALIRSKAGLHLAAPLAAVLGLLCALAGAPPARAQENLPEAENVAARLSDPATRTQDLYRLAATARLLQRAGRGETMDPVAALGEDAQWLRRLAARYGTTRPRSPVLDPSAWLIQLELSQHELPGDKLVAPGGPGLDVYLDQVFDRSEERLAAVILPELLWQIEPRGTEIWQRFREQMATNEALAAAISANPPAWLGEWAGAEATETAGESRQAPGDFLPVLESQLESAVAAGPPNAREQARMRYALLLGLPAMEPAARADAVAILRMSDLLDGLHDGRYFAFTEGLLALVSGLLDRAFAEPPQTSVLTGWLAAALPSLSARYARTFATVDPRLNSAVAAAFDVVTGLARPEQKAPNWLAMQTELADAAAQLTLLIPDLSYYFGLPVRDPIAGGMDACTGLMARQEADGSPAMTRDLFDDCQQSLVDLADTEARAAALAGDFNGPFGADALERELRVTSGQRINYGIGYLHQRYATGCARPARPLPNPLEWSALATLLAWFAEQSPIYFKTPQNEVRLKRMQDIGDELLREVAEQVDCFAGAGTAVNDPVARTLVDYRRALVAVSSGISTAVASFRAGTLKPGADVALKGDASQTTAYRPDQLMIGPCDAEQVCEMTGQLASTRALLGLFPDEFLLADQLRHGSVEICYDEMSWVRRRSQPVRADDTNVANYFGHLSFKLLGRYRLGEELSEVFGFQFTSPREHHYLFAANSEEVLQDECPVEWIGQRIVTPLLDDHRSIVPNRLTYLAAPRMQPSRLLARNWGRGAEWRDWFITGIGVQELAIPEPPDIQRELNQQLQALYRAEQGAIYNSLIRPPTRGIAMPVPSLHAEASRLSTVKALMRQQLTLFYPQLLLESDELRSAAAGQGGLLDHSIIMRLRNDNVAVEDINELAFERLQRVEQVWRGQPELIRRTGSVAGSLAHAMMRLNALYLAHFAAPPETAQGAQPEPPSVTGD